MWIDECRLAIEIVLMMLSLLIDFFEHNMNVNCTL